MAKKAPAAVVRHKRGIVSLGRLEANSGQGEVYVYEVINDHDADDVWFGTLKEARMLRDLLIALDLGDRK